MEAYSEWVYGTNRPIQFRLLTVGVTLFLLFHLTRTTWMTWDVIIPLIATFAILYIVYRKTIYERYSVMEQLNNQLVQINIDKYPDLQTDLNIVRILLDLKPMMRIDRIKYTEFVEHINEFFRVYRTLSNTHHSPEHIYEFCRESARQALNTLTNFVFNSPVYPQMKEDRTLSTTHGHLIPEIGTYESLLQTIFSRYLDEIELRVNRDWKQGSINHLSKPVISQQPTARDPYMDIRYELYV